jgi:hypothetical protein
LFAVSISRGAYLSHVGLGEKIRRIFSPKLTALANFLMEETQENAAAPTVIVVLMLIYQMIKHVQGLQCGMIYKFLIVKKLKLIDQILFKNSHQ